MLQFEDFPPASVAVRITEFERKQWEPTLSASALETLRRAYNEAVHVFATTLTNDECNRIWLRDKHCMGDVQRALLEAKNVYEARSKQSTVWKWLSKLSSRVWYYAGVMDVLLEHHPESISLAWGTMKFLLVALLNHEELLLQLSKGLSQIADALPRVEIKHSLFLTETMKSAVATLYAYIITFCQRAVKWYTEGRMTTTGLTALRFKDLVEEIAECSRRIDNLVVTSAQAEQRAMHLRLQRVEQMLNAHQNFHSASHLDTNRRVCGIQSPQILTFMASTTLPDPEESFQYCMAMSNRRRSRRINVQDPIWQSPKMQAWASGRFSSLTMIKGSYTTRHAAKDFAADIVGLLRTTKVPIVWVLNASREVPNTEPTAIDVLKQITLQVWKINSTLLDGRSLSLNAARFQSASSESDWFHLLGSALTGLPLVYIVIDVETVKSRLAYDFSWSAAFSRLFEDLSIRGISTTIKVVLISYGTGPLATRCFSLEEPNACIIRIEKKPRSRRYAHAKIRKRGVEVLRPLLINTAALM